MCVLSFLALMKVQCDEPGGRILLGDNTVSWIFKLLEIGVPVFWSLDFNWTFFYVHTYFSANVRNSDSSKIWPAHVLDD